MPKRARERDRPVSGRAAAPSRALALGQGIMFVVSGAWPIVSMRTFEAVTGPKTDDWLVRTVGALMVVIGAGLVLGREHPSAVRPFGMGASVALLGADVIGVASGRLSRVYLLDAALQVLPLAGWAGSLVTGPEPRSAPHAEPDRRAS